MSMALTIFEEIFIPYLTRADFIFYPELDLGGRIVLFWN